MIYLLRGVCTHSRADEVMFDLLKCCSEVILPQLGRLWLDWFFQQIKTELSKDKPRANKSFRAA